MTCSNRLSLRVHTSRDTASHLAPHIAKCSRRTTDTCTTHKQERDVDFLLALFTGNVVVTDAVIDTFFAVGG